jgi:thiol-disulfide isomerase/thioredoxin
MAATESVMLPLGTPAPDFALSDVVSGETINLARFADKSALLVMFICPHCPFVVHVESELARIGKDYAGKPLGIVAICANDVAQYPQDGPDGMRGQAAKIGFNFPYCLDESQDVARAYRAACTPDLYLFDAQRRLVYRGQLDSSRPGNGIPVTGDDLRKAIDATLAGQPVVAGQRPSIGCNIKWK